MRFCSNCQNMYYIHFDNNNPNSFTFICRQCGDKKTDLDNDDYTISKLMIKKNKNIQSFHHIINKYTKFDPTLERKNDILCPNPNCETNTNTNINSINNNREIIYIRYDEENMKYAFLCCTCDTVWNSIHL